MNWFTKTTLEIEKELSSNLKEGLSSEEASKKLESYGRNELEETEKRSIFSKLKDEFKDPLIIILILAALISFYLKDFIEGVIILAIVIINAALSIYQEGKAEEAIDSLKKMSSPNAKILRDGKIKSIPSEEIVPGDIVLLETGDIVPADTRLIESSNLKIDESSLTGESVPVEKEAIDITDPHLEIGDRKNYCYSSTIISYGRAKGIVTETGHKTEIGKIASSLLKVEDEETPPTKKIKPTFKITWNYYRWNLFNSSSRWSNL